MRLHLSHRLGEDEVGQRALQLLGAKLAPNTYSSYCGKTLKFLQFCKEYNVDPLTCSTIDVIRYVSWLGLQGSVAADSLQPYLSAINTMRTDLALPAVAKGALVRGAVQGLRSLQVVPDKLSGRHPLPSPVVYKILVRAASLAQQLGHLQSTSYQARLHLMTQLRCCLSVVMAFLFMLRPKYTALLEDSGLTVDAGSNAQLVHTPVGTKTRLRVARWKNAPRTVPTTAFTAPCSSLPPVDLGALLSTFKEQRWELHKHSPPAHLWALPGDRPTTWSASTLATWLQDALRQTQQAPPPGHKWTGHSARGGSASAASAIGAPRPSVCFVGDWSPASSTLEKHYIDPTVQPCPAAWFFFGWLVPHPG